MKNMTFKKFILTLLIIIMTLISVCFSGLLKRTEASAESKVAYNYLINFIKHNPDRTAGTEGGKNAANFIANYFVNLGLEKSGERFLSEVKYVDSNSKVITDYNVVGIKKGTSSQGKKVIIGAHYDNYTSTVYTEKGQGVYDNGTGVAAMLAIIDRIKNMDFEFDIEFVAFAAEEEGLYGSKEYLSALSDDEKNNILLYINLDSVAGGDYTYIYADEVGREHMNFFKKVISLHNLNVKVMERGKNIISADNKLADMPYYHYGIMSDNATFLKEGINSINIFSANLESTIGVNSESENHEDIMHTPGDTLDNLIEFLGEEKLIADLNTAVNLVVNAVTGEYFLNTMINSQSKYYDYRIWYNMYFVYGMYALVLIIGALIFDFIYKKYKTEQDKAPKEEISFEKVNINDIFRNDNVSSSAFEEFDDKAQQSGYNYGNQKDDNPFDEFK